MRGNQSSPTKDCKYLNRNSSENRIYKIEFVHWHCSGWDKYKMFVYSPCCWSAAQYLTGI